MKRASFSVLFSFGQVAVWVKHSNTHPAYLTYLANYHYFQIILAIEEEREEMMIPKHMEKYATFQYLFGTKMWRRCAQIFGNFEYMKTFENIREN